MDEEPTTVAVQRYQDQLAGDAPAEPVVRALPDRAVRRLLQLFAALLRRTGYRFNAARLALRVTPIRESAGATHLHFLCLDCRKIECLDGTSVATALAPAIRRATNGTISEVLLKGRCRQCK